MTKPSSNPVDFRVKKPPSLPGKRCASSLGESSPAKRSRSRSSTPQLAAKSSNDICTEGKAAALVSRVGAWGLKKGKSWGNERENQSNGCL